MKYMLRLHVYGRDVGGLIGATVVMVATGQSVGIGEDRDCTLRGGYINQTGGGQNFGWSGIYLRPLLPCRWIPVHRFTDRQMDSRTRALACLYSKITLHI